ncbi:MAG TPA: hypothetical protein VJB56_02295 [Candidatus Paceibacterota bacterium]
MLLDKNDSTLMFRKSSAYPRRHRSVFFMAATFCLILAGGYIAFRTSSLFRALGIDIEKPVEGEFVRGDAVSIRGSTEPNSRLTINGYEAFSGDDGRFDLELPMQKGFNILDIRAKNRLGKEARIVRRVVVE